MTTIRTLRGVMPIKCRYTRPGTKTSTQRLLFGSDLIVTDQPSAMAREATMTVKEILSHKGVDVVTTDPHASIADAVKLLAARRIGAVVVTGADRRIVGILSERDIVRALADKGSGALDAPVAEVMTRKVDTCSLTQTVSELMEQMTSGKFRHVPVVEQGRLAGIISIGDVVKSRVQEMEQESAALKDYIRTA
jgi:CBS domain-containing protein